MSAARNVAAGLARSDRPVTLDSDDLNHPDRAARCRVLLDPAEPQLIYTRVRLLSDQQPEGRPKRVLHPISAPLLEMMNFITNPGTASTRRTIQAVDPGFRPEPVMAEDHDLYLRMARAGVAIREVDEEHVSYRTHAGATTSVRRDEPHAAVMRVRALNDVRPFPPGGDPRTLP